MMQNGGRIIRQIKQSRRLICSKKAKGYCLNLNQKEIQVYRNDNESNKQETAFLSGKYEKAHDKQKQSKKTLEKT